ncbi:MAG: hypothetical protein IJX14_02155 [Clostridia bacterium]|nr:hypothetical protein [Clostridia bacterium]
MNESLAAALRRIAWGWILLHCNFNLGTLNILPDWLGYVLILNALSVLARSVRSASLLFPFGIGLAMWSLVTWFLAIFGVSVTSLWLDLPVTVISLYFQFQLLTDLAQLADDWFCEQGSALRKFRTVQTVLTTVLWLIGFFMVNKTVYNIADVLDGTFWGFALTVLLIAGFITTICIARQLFSLQRDIAYLTETQPIPISTYACPENDPPEPDEDPSDADPSDADPSDADPSDTDTTE